MTHTARRKALQRAWLKMWDKPPVTIGRLRADMIRRDTGRRAPLRRVWPMRDMLTAAGIALGIMLILHAETIARLIVHIVTE